MASAGSVAIVEGPGYRCMSCAAARCPNLSEKFVAVPKDKELRERWSEAAGFELPSMGCLCLGHFSPGAIDLDNKCLRSADALPDVLPRIMARTRREMREQPLLARSSKRVDPKEKKNIELELPQMMEQEPSASTEGHAFSEDIVPEIQETAELSHQAQAKLVFSSFIERRRGTSSSGAATSATLESRGTDFTVQSEDFETDFFNDEEEEMEGVEESPDLTRQSIVVNSQLMKLFRFCPECGSRILPETVKYFSFGVCRRVTYECHGTCSPGIWWSQEAVEIKGKPGVKLYTGNVQLAAGVICTGNQYTPLKELADLMKLDFPGKENFYSLQRPIILSETFKLSLPFAVDKLIETNRLVTKKQVEDTKQKLSIAGDGRYDSAGHCAGECTYTVLDVNTDKVLACETMSLADDGATSSPVMERVLFNRCMEQLTHRFPKQIAVFASDDHPMIAKDLRDIWGVRFEILRQICVWHFVKNVHNKLFTDASRTIAKRKLLHWLPSICNHIYYSCEIVSRMEISQTDKAIQLKERLLGMLKHTCNIHEWADDTDFSVVHCCDHGPYTKEEEQDGLWLKNGEQAHALLSNAVKDKKFQKKMELLTEFIFTSRLESLHALMRKYAEKRIGYSTTGYEARVQLAVLDYSENLGRQQATDTAGIPLYSRYMPKKRGEAVETVRPVLQPKTTHFREEILNKTMQCIVEGFEAGMPIRDKREMQVRDPAIFRKGDRDHTKDELISQKEAKEARRKT